MSKLLSLWTLHPRTTKTTGDYKPKIWTRRIPLICIDHIWDSQPSYNNVTTSTFAVPISCQSLISNCDIGIASSSKQNDDHCPHYQWHCVQGMWWWKGPRWDCWPSPQPKSTATGWRRPTRLHSPSIDSERGPRRVIPQPPAENLGTGGQASQSSNILCWKKSSQEFVGQKSSLPSYFMKSNLPTKFDRRIWQITVFFFLICIIAQQM